MKKTLCLLITIFSAIFVFNLKVDAAWNGKICEYSFPNASKYKIYSLNFSTDGKSVKGTAFTSDRSSSNSDDPKYWSNGSKVRDWYVENRKCPVVVMQETFWGITYSVYTSTKEANETEKTLKGVVGVATGTDVTSGSSYTCDERVNELSNSKLTNAGKQIICKKSLAGGVAEISGPCINNSQPVKDQYCNRYEFAYCKFARDGVSAFNQEVTRFTNSSTSGSEINVTGIVRQTTLSTNYYGDDLNDESTKSTFTVGDFYTCADPIKTTDPDYFPQAPTSPTVDVSSACKGAINFSNTSLSNWEYQSSIYRQTGNGVDTCNYVQCKTMTACKYDTGNGFWLCDTYKYVGEIDKCRNGEDVPDDDNTNKKTNSDEEATGICPLGKDVTEDLRGLWNIMKIVVPIMVIALTVMDMIKTLTNGDIQTDSKKIAIRFGKRILLVVILLSLNAILDVFFGFVLNVEYCDLTDTTGNGVEVSDK